MENETCGSKITVWMKLLTTFGVATIIVIYGYGQLNHKVETNCAEIAKQAETDSRHYHSIGALDRAMIEQRTDIVYIKEGIKEIKTKLDK